MRNIVARYWKLGVTVGVAVFLLTVMSFAKTGAWGHEEHPVPLAVGDVHSMIAICYAAGANKVAMANLLAGNIDDGNKMFDRQTRATPPQCFAWGHPINLSVQEVLYVGEQRGLHVYIVRFGDKAYAVVVVRRGASKTGFRI